MESNHPLLDAGQEQFDEISSQLLSFIKTMKESGARQLRFDKQCHEHLEQIIDGTAPTFSRDEVLILSGAMKDGKLDGRGLHVAGLLDGILQTRVEALNVTADDSSDQSTDGLSEPQLIDEILAGDEELDVSDDNQQGLFEEPVVSQPAAKEVKVDPDVDEGEFKDALIEDSESSLADQMVINDDGRKTKFRDLQTMMTHSFFAPAQKGNAQGKWSSAISYKDKTIEYTISPNASHGLATINDKDLLIWFISKINQRLRNGQKLSNRIRFNPAAYFKDTKKKRGGSQYQQLMQSLNRLKGTMVTIKRHSIKGDLGDAYKRAYKFGQAFNWIDDFEWVEEDGPKGRLKEVTVRLPDWIIEQIKQGGHQMLLSVDEEYFELKKFVEKMLYVIARKYCGRDVTAKDNEIQFKLSTLYLRCYPDRLDKSRSVEDMLKENSEHWRMFRKEVRALSDEGAGKGIVSYGVKFETKNLAGRRLKDPKITIYLKNEAPVDAEEFELNEPADIGAEETDEIIETFEE